jgi:hypothetical protein
MPVLSSSSKNEKGRNKARQQDDDEEAMQVDKEDGIEPEDGVKANGSRQEEDLRQVTRYNSSSN